MFFYGKILMVFADGGKPSRTSMKMV